MKLVVAAEIFPEGSVMVAYAKALDVSSCGKTVDEALRALMEAVQLFIETSLRMGTFEQILIESGYVRQGNEWILQTSSEEQSENWSPDNIVPLSDITRRLACVEI